MFRVGQKVVCIDDSGSAAMYFKVGDIFTVLGLCGQLGSPICIEINCRPSPRGNRSWSRSRFRPIQERKTDISIFTDILDKVSRGDLIMVEF